MLFSGYHLGIHLLNSTTKGIALDREKTIEGGSLKIDEWGIHKNPGRSTRNSITVLEGYWKGDVQPKKVVVKQTKSLDTNRLSSILNEHNIYNILRSFGLSKIIGEYITYDEFLFLLFFHYTEQPSLSRLQKVEAEPYQADFAQVLTQLAVCFDQFHTISKTDVAQNKLNATFGFRKPLFWAISQRDLTNNLLDKPSPSQQFVIKCLSENDYKLFDAIQNLGWQADSLIHFDFKFAHVHCEDQGQYMRFIDWEMADLGDIHWDIACVWYETLTLYLTNRGDKLKILTKSVANLNTFLAGYQNVIDIQKLCGYFGALLFHNHYYGFFPTQGISDTTGQAWLTEVATVYILGGDNLPKPTQTNAAANPIQLKYTALPAPPPAPSARSGRGVDSGETTIDPVLENDLFPEVRKKYSDPTTPPSVAALSSLIYKWYYGEFDPTLSGFKSKLKHSKETVGLPPLVGAALTTNLWWEVEGITSNKSVVVRKTSEKRCVAAGEYIITKNTIPKYQTDISKSDQTYVSLYYPRFFVRPNDEKRESNDLWILGEIPLRQDHANWTRFYFHLNEDLEGIRFFINELSRRLNERTIPFEIKLRNARSSYYRADTGILFLHRQHFIASIDTIAIVYNQLKTNGYLRDQTPKFTKVFKDPSQTVFGGLAFGENPLVVDQSFGGWRAKLIAKILVDNWTSPDWLRVVKQELLRLGFNIHEMYRNPFDTQSEFSFRYDLLKDKLKTPPKAGSDLASTIELLPSQRFLKAAQTIAFVLCREAIWYGNVCTWIAFKLDAEKMPYFETVSPCERDGIGLFLAGMAILCPNEPIFYQTAYGAYIDSAKKGRLPSKLSADDLYKIFLSNINTCPPPPLPKEDEETDADPLESATIRTILDTYNIDFKKPLYTSILVADSIISKYMDKNLPFPNIFGKGWNDEYGSEFNPTLLQGLAGLGYFFMDLSEQEDTNRITPIGKIETLQAVLEKFVPPGNTQ